MCYWLEVGEINMTVSVPFCAKLVNRKDKLSHHNDKKVLYFCGAG
jgi:hypothetical protein